MISLEAKIYWLTIGLSLAHLGCWTQVNVGGNEASGCVQPEQRKTQKTQSLLSCEGDVTCGMKA